MTDRDAWDVIVVGGGNAALCAALAAQETGASVLLLKKAPEAERGGNSLFTAGGFRFAHRGLEDLRRDVLVDLTEGEARAVEVPPYTEEMFYDDLARVTENLTNPDLADVLVRQSRPTVVWMRTQGVRWILMFGRQSYKVGDRHHFWGGLNVEGVGGGPGLVQALYERAEKGGVQVHYGTGARRLLVDAHGAVTGVLARGPGGGLTSCRRGRWCWRAAASRRIRSGGPATSDRTGSWRGSAAPATTRATASGWRSRSAPSRTGIGRPATPSPGT